jgi:acyl-CoA synthetase (NDP forming)
MASGGADRSYQVSLKEIMADENVDGVIFISLLLSTDHLFRLRDREAIADIARSNRSKPLILFFAGPPEEVAEAAAFFEDRGIPLYPSVRLAIKALGALYKYRAFPS